MKNQKDHKLSRRDLLKASLMLATGLPLLSGCERLVGVDPALKFKKLFGSDAPELVVIGNFYIKSEYGAEVSTEQILKLLPSTQEKDGLSTALQSRIKEDYQRSNLFEFDGWFFSKTEAQIAALYALTSAQLSK